MLVPSAFKIDDPNEVAAFLKAYSFATIFSTGSSGPMAAHVPLLSEDYLKLGKLRGHVTAMNPVVSAIRESGSMLAVFQGPHGYISSSWYIDGKIPPTWNFTAAHLKGEARILDTDEDKLSILRETVDTYERRNGSNWTFSFQDTDILEMLPMIVGFELQVSETQCCYKLSQNRESGDHASVISNLEKAGTHEAKELARWMVEKSVQTSTLKSSRGISK